MSLDRKTYLKRLGWIHKDLAAKIGVSNKTVQRWAAGKPVDRETDETICQTLAVHANFFRTAEQLREALDIAWHDLTGACPLFQQRLQRITRSDEAEVLNTICTDLVQTSGRNCVRPSISRLASGEIVIRTTAELNAIENFMGYAFMYTLDPDHPLSVNASERSTEPMVLTGIAREYVARMLVHYQYPVEIGPMFVEVEEEEIKPSRNSVFFEDTASVEQPVEEQALAFVKTVAQTRRPEAYAKLARENEDSDFDTEEFDKLVAAINGEIGNANVSPDYTLGVAGPNANIDCARYVKRNHFPNLRTACFTHGAIGNILSCGKDSDEHTIDAFIKYTAGVIQTLRAGLSQPNKRTQERQFMNKTKIEIHGPVGNLATENHGTMNATQLSAVEFEEGRTLVRAIAEELSNNGHEMEAENWRGVADEEDGNAFINKAGQLVTAADAPLSVSANAVALAAQLVAWLSPFTGG